MWEVYNVLGQRIDMVIFCLKVSILMATLSGLEERERGILRGSNHRTPPAETVPFGNLQLQFYGVEGVQVMKSASPSLIV